MENIEKFEELAKLTAIYNRNSKHLIKELGVWKSHSYMDDPNHFSILFTEMVRQFPKSEIELTDNGSEDYPYKAHVKVHAIEITALASQKDFEKYYPERIKSEIEKLEQQLAKLKGGDIQ